MLHERALHRSPSPSDLVARELAFSWQRFAQIAHELPPLFQRHWEELALNKDAVPLAPDWDRYYQLDLQNALRILTVRDGDKLVGYVFMLFGPHLHYATTLWAQGDMFWLDPLYRQGWTGVKMFKEVIRAVRKWDGTVLQLVVKHHFMDGRVATLLQRLGFTPTETVLAMRLK